MIAWSQALAEHGQTDEASYLAARLREFNNVDPGVDRFFAACKLVTVTVDNQPYQCKAASGRLTWRDFLD
jgi:hypothetical protein